MAGGGALSELGRDDKQAEGFGGGGAHLGGWHSEEEGGMTGAGGATQ